MPRQTAAERAKALREKAAAEKTAAVSQPKGFDSSKLSEVAVSEKKAPAVRKGREQKNYYEAKRDEPMIARVEQLRPYKMLESKGVESVDVIIARYREKGSIHDRNRLNVLAYGGYGVFSSARFADRVVAIAFNRYNDKDGNVAKAEVKDVRNMFWDSESKSYRLAGGKNYKSVIAEACDALKMNAAQIDEFLSKGYIEGTVSKCVSTKKAQELFDRGKLSLEDLSKPENTLGVCVSSWPDGYPLVFYVDAAKRDMERMMGVKDKDGNPMGFAFKDFEHTYTITPEQLDSLAFGGTVTVTSDKGRTESLRFNPYAGKVTPVAMIGVSLRKASGLDKGEAAARDIDAEAAEEVSQAEAADMGLDK